MKRKDNTDADYIYRGQTIKPQIIADLVKQLFAGKLVERQTIIDEVLNTHLKGGGLRAEGANFPLSVTKALTKLKKLGEAENPSYSYWKILPADTEATPEHADLNGSATLSDIESAAAHIPNDPLAEVTIGTGPGCVYVYYLPTYKMRAQERGERSWPCKIGETEGNALHRVLSQVATALPERPIFPVVFRSNYSKALEKAFHGFSHYEVCESKMFQALSGF